VRLGSVPDVDPGDGTVMNPGYARPVGAAGSDLLTGSRGRSRPVLRAGDPDTMPVRFLEESWIPGSMRRYRSGRHAEWVGRWQRLSWRWHPRGDEMANELCVPCFLSIHSGRQRALRLGAIALIAQARVRTV